VQSPGLEHAHRLQITALDTAELHGRTVLFTGSLDGTIRVWSYDAASAQFQFHNTLEGHIRGAYGARACREALSARCHCGPCPLF